MNNDFWSPANYKYRRISFFHACLFILKGNVTFACLEAVDVPVTFTSPGSFLQLPWTLTRDTTSVGLQFRTWNKAGLLMTFDLQHQAGTLWVYLSEARARLQVHKAGRVMMDITAGISRRLCTGYALNSTYRTVIIMGFLLTRISRSAQGK